MSIFLHLENEKNVKMVYMKSIKTSVSSSDLYKQITPPIKKRKQKKIPHRQEREENPSWENFLKRMNSIYHTDGTLCEREKEIGRMRAMQTDTGRYIGRDV